MRVLQRHAVRRAAFSASAIPSATLLFLLSAVASVASQESAGGGTSSTALRLGDVYAGVVRSNPKIAAARALERATWAEVPAASRPPDPQLQLGFMNYALPSLAPMPLIGMAQLTLMQMLPIPGKLGLAGRVAAAQASAGAERADDVRWDLHREVATTFYELYAADRELEVARETLRLLHEISRTTEAMYRVGEGHQADVLRSQVEIARMEEDTLRMTAMRVAASARMNALLDRAADEPVASPMLPSFPDAVPPEDSLLARGAADRPMVKADVQSVEAAKADERLARKAIWPDLTIGVQYGQRGGDGGTERMGSFMIGASIPVFAGARQLRMREEATAMRQMAEADLAESRADTRARIAAAYADLLRARRLQVLYRSSVLPQAEATVASAMSAYRVGNVDFMTLLDDQLMVNRYRQDLAMLEADEGTAWAKLESLTGCAVFDPDATRTTALRTAPLPRAMEVNSDAP